MYWRSEKEEEEKRDFSLKSDLINTREPTTMKSLSYNTYSPFEVSGTDTEADGNVDANSWDLVIRAQRHLLVNLLGQSQRRRHLDNRTGPIKAHSGK